MTADELKSRLHYNPDTGIFRWINGQRAGQPAGSAVCVGDRARNEYIQIRISGRNLYAHRLAWLYVTGEMPTLKIGHVNGNGLDNRWENLVHVNAFENWRLCAQVPPEKLRYPGVRETRGRFTARIKLQGRYMHLGVFDTAELAHAAHVDAKSHSRDGVGRLKGGAK